MNTEQDIVDQKTINDKITRDKNSRDKNLNEIFKAAELFHNLKNPIATLKQSNNQKGLID